MSVPRSVLTAEQLAEDVRAGLGSLSGTQVRSSLDSLAALLAHVEAQERALAESQEAIRGYVLAIGRAPNNRDENEVLRASEALAAIAMEAALASTGSPAGEHPRTVWVDEPGGTAHWASNWELSQMAGGAGASDTAEPDNPFADVSSYLLHDWLCANGFGETAGTICARLANATAEANEDRGDETLRETSRVGGLHPESLVAPAAAPLPGSDTEDHVVTKERSCCVCGATDDLRVAPLMTGGRFADPPNPPVCSLCYLAWYEHGETTIEGILARRAGAVLPGSDTARPSEETP